MNLSLSQGNNKPSYKVRTYERSADNHLVGFLDVDWAGDMKDRHSTTENLFIMSGAAMTGSARSNQLLLYPPLRQNTLLLVKPHKKLYG